MGAAACDTIQLQNHISSNGICFGKDDITAMKGILSVFPALVMAFAARVNAGKTDIDAKVMNNFECKYEGERG